MNLIPVAAAAVVVAAVPPLRRRVVPVAGATADACLKTATSALVSGVAIATTAVQGAGEVVAAVRRSPADAEA